MKDKYLAHLGILFVGMSTAAYFFSYYRFNTNAQVIVAALGCIYYAGWGIVHHAVRNRLNRLIALEYILVSSLIFLLLFVSLSV